MSRVVLVILLLSAAPLVGCLGENDPGSPEREPTDGTPSSNSSSTPPAWGTPEEATIRPGASLGGYCTYNFLFTSRTNGTAYIGTAGHCTDGPGERVALGSDGPEIGTVVVDSDNASAMDDATDFSLVRLDPGKVGDAHPKMLGWEAPTGVLNASEASQGDEVALHGYGVLVGQQEPTRDRTGVLVAMTEEEYDADMPAVNGDSGSPLIHTATGKALGIISHYGVGDTPPTTDEGPTVGFILDQLASAGWPVDLATAG